MPSSPAVQPVASQEKGTPPRTFQDLIFVLQKYWADQGCVILQPYDMEMGAGTFHTATFLRAPRVFPKDKPSFHGGEGLDEVRRMAVEL